MISMTSIYGMMRKATYSRMELFYYFHFSVSVGKVFSSEKRKKFKNSKEGNAVNEGMILKLKYGLNLYLLMKIENDAMYMWIST